MAVSLSSHNLFASRICASSKPSQTLEFKYLSLESLYHRPPQLCQPITRFSLWNSSPRKIDNHNTRRSFKFSLAARNSAPTTNDEEDSQNDLKTSERRAEQQHLSSLKTLLEVYKEAILDGDEKTVSDIEAKIYIVENEKNELVQKVSALSAEITSGKKKYIHLQADFDNFRKRSEKERLTIRTDAQGEVIESLLAMVDNFERAKQQIKPETEREMMIDTSYQGIYKQFVEIMRSLRVAAVPTVGKPFDPSVHEAIAREESQEYKEGIVIEEFRRGFLLGGRLLRPATVKVSTGRGSKKALFPTAKSSAAAGGVDGR